MHHSPLQNFVHAISHQAQHERAHGNTGRANGLAMIAFGVVLLPIPFIGIPLLLAGLWQAFTAEDPK